MGRQRPATRLSTTRRHEIDLAHAVDAAMDRLRPPEHRERDDAELAAAVDQVLEEVALPTAEGATPVEADGLQLPLPLVLLDGLEVTQEIQDLAHSVPLVAGKATVVRVYLQYPPSAVAVRGELMVARTPLGPWRAVSSLGAAQLDPTRSGSGLANLRSRRGELGWSLNFLLPDDVTGAGTLWIRMGAVRRATGTPLPSLAGLALHTVAFKPAAPLRLRLVRLRYTMGAPAVTYEPTATDQDHLASWLRRAYPIAELDMSTTTAVAAPAAPFGASQINAQLIALRALDVATGTDARTHYYGMVSDGGFFMRGLASGIPGTPQPGTVASGPTGPGTFGWDTDGSYGDWYGGHELGHTFGRFHAEFCGATDGAPFPFPNGQLSDADEKFAGLDVGDAALGLPMRVMGGTTSHDVMTYCTYQWLSSFTYGGIYDRLIAEGALAPGAGAGPVAFAAAAGDALHIVAALNLTQGTGSVVSVLPGDAAAPDGDGDGDGDGLTIRLRDGAGELLAERPVPFRRSACEDPEDDVSGVVDAVVAVPPGAEVAVVELVANGRVVDSHPVGGEPSAQAERVDAGGPGPSGTIDLRWDVPDAPAAQRYAVQVSEDSGATWQTIAVGLADPAVTLVPDHYRNDSVDVRVIATTGTGIAVVGTETVQVR